MRLENALPAPSSPRSGAGGSTEGGLQSRDAFEGAVADAGKRQSREGEQGGKDGSAQGVDTEAQGTVPASSGSSRIALSSAFTLRTLATPAGTMKMPAAEADGLAKAEGRTVLNRPRNTTDDIESGSEPASAQDQTVERPRTAAQAARLAELRRLQAAAAHNAQSDPAKGAQGGSEQTAVGAATPPGMLADTGQLLRMLGAPAAGGDSPVVDEAMLISDFHAMIDRARKARDGSADETGGTTRKGDDGSDAVDGETMPTATDQMFRFARADGKGKAMSMSLSEDGERAIVRPELAGGSARGEAVTVLDARRFLGLAPTGNAAALTTAITQDPQWAEALRPSTGTAETAEASATGKVVNTLKIQMHPIDLGMVTATLRLQGEELHVALKVETGEAYRQLTQDQGEMVKALRAQGFAVDQISVVFNAGDSSSQGQQQQQQTLPDRQAAEQRFAGERGMEGERQRGNSGGQTASGDRWAGGNATVDEPAAGGQRNRPGDVYI